MSLVHERTLKNTAVVAGRGYWSGQAITVRLQPAQPGSGIRFLRTDVVESLEDSSNLEAATIPALVSFRESMSLRTQLRNENGHAVAMVEHLMAALFAFEIDNCLVEVDAEEMPGLDGSADAFVKAIGEAGFVEQELPANVIAVDRVVRLGTAANWIEASPSDSGLLEVEYRLDYGEECPIPMQSAACQVTRESFACELSKARTFVTPEQAAQLRESGVASHVTPADLLIFDEQGLVENELHFDNECARHKALDMVGDLALTGVRVAGRFVSYRGGHELNATMAKKLRELYLPEGLAPRTIGLAAKMSA